MKNLYLIRAESNDGGRSDKIAADLTFRSLPFTSKTFGIDPLPWHQISTVPCIVIDVDGTQHVTFDDRQNAPIDIAAVDVQFAAAPTALPAPKPDLINLPVTRAQATAILKALLENPPTGINPWTQIQRDQCAYLLLIGLFRDLKNGSVY